MYNEVRECVNCKENLLSIQADLFATKLNAAGELVNKGFYRAAGVITSIVLEKHLLALCKNRNLLLEQQELSITEFNQLLKKEDVIEVAVFRRIQMLDEISYLCFNSKKFEPTVRDITDLIQGTTWIVKTLF